MQPEPSHVELARLIGAARGEEPCEIVFEGGFVVNVFTGEILRADVGIVGGRIAAVSTNGKIQAERQVDVTGLLLTPGLIDAHMHLESSMLTPAEFARAVLPLGTTSVVVDPHEIASIAGADGIRELMAACHDLPLRFHFMIPPAVPANEFEGSVGRLDADDIAAFAEGADVLGIAEETDWEGVLSARPEVLARIACMPGKVIDGHAPGLSECDLQACAAAGISSDHESTNYWEAMDKLRSGMYLMIREGSAAKDLDELIGVVDANTERRCLLVTDDLTPNDILMHGHIDHLLRRAVAHGIGPVQAVRMATLNAAQRFKIDCLGAIAPGYAADIAAFEDLSEFRAALVVAKGEVVAADGRLVVSLRHHRWDDRLLRSVHLSPITTADLTIPAMGGVARIIQASGDQIATSQLFTAPSSLSGRVVADVARDILKIVVVERHGLSGSIGLGLVNGFGLRRGAIASSVAHDAHNIVATGASDSEILRAIMRVAEMDGGLAIVAGSEVVADLPLPIGGLMSKLDAGDVARKLRRIDEAARGLGSRMEHPLTTLSFMCLTSVPEVRITSQGLVDAARGEIVPLFVEETSHEKAA